MTFELQTRQCRFPCGQRRDRPALLPPHNPIRAPRSVVQTPYWDAHHSTSTFSVRWNVANASMGSGQGQVATARRQSSYIDSIIGQDEITLVPGDPLERLRGQGWKTCNPAAVLHRVWTDLQVKRGTERCFARRAAYPDPYGLDDDAGDTCVSCDAEKTMVQCNTARMLETGALYASCAGRHVAR